MRILFAWHAAVEPEYRKMLAELSKLGHEVTLLCPTEWTEAGRLQRMRNSVNGISIQALDIAFRDRLKGFFYYRVGRLKEVFEKTRPDVVHIFEEPYSFSCGQLVKLSKSHAPGAKIIVESFENLDQKQGFPFAAIERYVLGKADMLITIPAEGEKLWKNRGFDKKIRKVPVGLDEAVFRKTDSSGIRKRLRVAYAGRLVREKGVFLLLEAFAKVSGQFDCELAIAGSGDEAGLKDMAKALGISEKVIFAGNVESAALPDFYSRADVLVLPSLTTARWKEQFGRVLIEAMACETPVVGSTSGEIPNVIGGAGLVFREGDCVLLAGALKRLLASPEKRKRCSQAGRERVLKEFTWSAVAKKLEDAYREVCA